MGNVIKLQKDRTRSRPGQRITIKEMHATIDGRPESKNKIDRKGTSLYIKAGCYHDVTKLLVSWYLDNQEQLI